MITITSYIIVNICIFIVCLFCPKIWNLTVIKICILPCPIESLLLKGLWAPVAQLDRVAPSEGVGRTFESSRVRHFLYLTLMFAALVNHSCYSLTAPMGRRTFADTPLGVQFVRAKYVNVRHSVQKSTLAALPLTRIFGFNWREIFRLTSFEFSFEINNLVRPINLIMLSSIYLKA